MEDEPIVLQMAKDALEFLGYTVIEAATPEHAGDVDLLMTDVVMPRMSGAKLADRLSAMQPRLKCLFVSGYPIDDVAHRGVFEQSVHFLRKPHTLETLAAKVREALDDSP